MKNVSKWVKIASENFAKILYILFIFALFEGLLGKNLENQPSSNITFITMKTHFPPYLFIATCLSSNFHIRPS